MIVIVINGNRHLINEQSKAVDDSCERLLSRYPLDAIVEFDEVKMSDVI